MSERRRCFSGDEGYLRAVPSTLGHWSETFISTTYLHTGGARGGEGELEKQMAPLKEKSAQAGR